MSTQTLWQAVATWPSAIVIVDGARIAHAQQVLAHERIVAHSLILDAPRRPAPRTGPWMAHVDRDGIARLAGIPGMQGACVLWGGGWDPDSAFQHFRRINRSIIPREGGEGTERVLFRHWDSETLALTYPIMKPAQRAQLFGQFTMLALHSADAGGALIAHRQREWPAPPRPPIAFDADQIGQIEAAMRARSDRKIARYLRRNAGPHLDSVDDAALHRHVADWRAQAGTWGATSEAGVGRFAWLQLVTGGRFAQMPGVRATLTRTPGASTDLQLKRLMHVMVHKMRGGA